MGQTKRHDNEHDETGCAAEMPAAAAAPPGLTTAQRTVLLAITSGVGRTADLLFAGIGLNKGAVALVLASLARKGLMTREQGKESAEPLWTITRAGQSAIAGANGAAKVNPEAAQIAQTDLQQTAVSSGVNEALTPCSTLLNSPDTCEQRARPLRGKLALIMELVSRAEGASLHELMDASGWQAHSVRGAIAVLRRSVDAAIRSRRLPTRGRVYERAGPSGQMDGQIGGQKDHQTGEGQTGEAL